MGEVLVVDQLELVVVLGRPVLLDKGEPGLRVYKDDFAGSFVDGEDAGHLSDGARAPDGD